MTVRFDPAARAATGPQPGLLRLRDYVLGRWGGQDLGIFANRAVRGGTSLSLHAEGRAFDWRAPSRAQLDELYAFLIAHADPLNVQAFHDYERSLRWQTGKGWYLARIGAGAGGPTTHIERNWDGARDQRLVEQIIRASHQEVRSMAKYTARAAIPFVPQLPNGRHPIIFAQLNDDGTTEVVVLGARINDANAQHADAFGVSVLKFGRLAAPIVDWQADVANRRMIGVADDAGSFHVPIGG